MRLQLALDVADLDAAVAFYERLFDTPVAKRKPGYANFAIEQPPLKLVLFEDPAATERPGVNHLGIEVGAAGEVEHAHERLERAGLAPTRVVEEQCCWADKVETWLAGPDGSRWEVYVKTGDLDTQDGAAPATSCCTDAGATDSSADAEPADAAAAGEPAIAASCCAA